MFAPRGEGVALETPYDYSAERQLGMVCLLPSTLVLAGLRLAVCMCCVFGVSTRPKQEENSPLETQMPPQGQQRYWRHRQSKTLPLLHKRPRLIFAARDILHSDVHACIHTTRSIENINITALSKAPPTGVVTHERPTNTRFHGNSVSYLDIPFGVVAPRVCGVSLHKKNVSADRGDRCIQV